MRNEELYTETNAAFALAVVLLNVLIILILAVSLWLAQSILSKPDSIGVFLQNSMTYR